MTMTDATTATTTKCAECAAGTCANCPLGLLNFFGTGLIDCACENTRHDAARTDRQANVELLGWER
ncbi:hypothetical protein [Microbacterium sp. 77mftsu3.1]|uniref:hypothetical protein n=1 Tax=Microbacterium sp. 77mftsu3.1 TaxID=1761802 RepID=UPI000365C281|nr:hypothetical protein [Microbacterium sp. 77mftsu3.1]